MVFRMDCLDTHPLVGEVLISIEGLKPSASRDVLNNSDS